MNHSLPECKCRGPSNAYTLKWIRKTPPNICSALPPIDADVYNPCSRWGCGRETSVITGSVTQSPSMPLRDTKYFGRSQEELCFCGITYSLLQTAVSSVNVFLRRSLVPGKTHLHTASAMSPSHSSIQSTIHSSHSTTALLFAQRTT